MSLCLSITNADLSITRDVVGIVGTVGALIIGGLGLSTWRRQLHGTSKFEVAKRILTTTYRVQDAIDWARNPMIQLNKEEFEAGRQLEEEQRIYAERLGKVNEHRAELRTLALEARAIWGESAQECFAPLHELVGKLHGEIWLHFWLKGAYAGPGTHVDRSPERIHKNDAIVYKTDDSDEFSQQLIEAVRHIESIYQPRLRA